MQKKSLIKNRAAAKKALLASKRPTKSQTLKPGTRFADASFAAPDSNFAVDGTVATPDGTLTSDGGVVTTDGGLVSE